MGTLTQFLDNTIPNTPWWVDMLLASIIGSLVLFTVVLSIGGLFTFAFRRIFARMGRRVGPNRVGPQGILQFVADGAKLISKEDVRPARADRIAWTAAVYVAVVFTVMAWAAIPWSETAIFANVWIGVFLILGMGAIAPLAEMMAGWGSNNKYALYGGVRAAALDVSYEIPMFFSIVAILALAGTSSTIGLVEWQADNMWFIIPQIVGFVIFFITALAKAGLVPTDLAESESELVAGFTTEYSGMRFGMFFVVIFSNVMFVGALTTLFFLGGYRAPVVGADHLLNTALGPVTPILWFLTKALLVSFVVFWIWSTLPRVRVDSYLRLAWKVLLPVSLLNLLGTLIAIRVLSGGAA